MQSPSLQHEDLHFGDVNIDVNGILAQIDVIQ
jgi:hypothetical protein